ncbi:hypothetical protein DIT72_13770 [Marinobacter orientalis]|uniref:D-glycerate 3-kinase n=1 Tax=Marinobacter orientalis TaxID=1928859 RepID=A0A7Y0RBW9_9GAMM|nr:hypothetical protein [Marinobacter orientalis]TGX48647.1 hypothetical protein DIT72_13770 [Marinobacter orientalis]
MTTTIQNLINQESLPASYADTVKKTILPLAQHIHSLRKAREEPVVIGINGAQGTGKSTLTEFLRELLTTHYRMPTASFSLDDLYLTRAEREKLAQDVHPLFITRGVPGTHDIALGQRVIDQLKAAGPGTETRIPVFDKSRDDRSPQHLWPVFRGRAEVILIEGWCMGAAPAASESELMQPVNELERSEDPEGTWRQYVNRCLKGGYGRFFNQIDSLIMLRAPSMECVLEWRTLQEHKLRERSGVAPKESEIASEAAQPSRIMSDEEVVRFIMHYERITRASLDEMPARADCLINVAEDHSFGEPLIRQRS